MGMPPRLGGRHWIQPAGGHADPGPAARAVADGGWAAEFVYPTQRDVTEDTAPIPVVIPGPRLPSDRITAGSRTVRIDAGTQRLFAPDAPHRSTRRETDSATVAAPPAQVGPVLVDSSGRRRHRLALAGASAVTICAAYLAVVGVSVLHGIEAGPLGSTLAGLLTPAGAGAFSGPVTERVRSTSSVQVAAPPTGRAQVAPTGATRGQRVALGSSVDSAITTSALPSSAAATGP